MKIEFSLYKQVKSAVPKEELIKCGFTIFKSKEDLNSNLNGVNIFKADSSELASLDFDFTKYDYVFTFGRIIKSYGLLRKVRKHGKTTYFIDLVYDTNLEPYIYIYKVAKKPSISPEIG